MLLAAAVAFWFLRLRSGLILPRAQQTIGMESTAGEIPCQLLGEAPDAAGMIVHWGNLGYLTVRMSRGRVILYKRMEMGNERKPSERRSLPRCFARALRVRRAACATRLPCARCRLRS